MLGVRLTARKWLIDAQALGHSPAKDAQGCNQQETNEVKVDEHPGAYAVTETVCFADVLLTLDVAVVSSLLEIIPFPPLLFWFYFFLYFRAPG